MRLRLVSIGGWCRPAHQIRVWAEGRSEFEAPASPFDWTITPFSALQTCLAPDFDPRKILASDQCVVSFAGSGMCQRSELVFHHDIPPAALEPIDGLDHGDVLPDTDQMSELRHKARYRFAHTMDRLKDDAATSDGLIFIRWQRGGHPDRQFPAAFEGESSHALAALIERFLGHQRFGLLVVTSETVSPENADIPDPIRRFRQSGRIIESTILERKGWNGDMTNDFRGDEISWSVLLDRAVSTWWQHGDLGI